MHYFCVGASRGFAFVEFQNLSEAVRWMELKQVLLRTSSKSQLAKIKSLSGIIKTASVAIDDLTLPSSLAYVRWLLRSCPMEKQWQQTRAGVCSYNHGKTDLWQLPVHYIWKWGIEEYTDTRHTEGCLITKTVSLQSMND